MQRANMKVVTQLRLGFIVILALVVFLGILSWKQADKLWLQVQTIYDHPLQVRRAIGRLETAFESMSRHQREIFLASDTLEIEKSLQSIEVEKTNAGKDLDVLLDRYLGPPGDVTDLTSNFARWNVLRDETIRLFRAGNRTDALARIQPGGVQDTQMALVSRHIRRIDDFASKKGDQLYQDATKLNDNLNIQLAIIVTLTLLFSLALSEYLVNRVKTPLQQLSATTEAFREGKISARCGYVSANEFGALSASFNALADSIQTQMQINLNAAHIARDILLEDEAHAFCQALLKALIQHTGSQMGAVYFLNDAKTAFEHFESIGMSSNARAAFSATKLEGELGAALATREILHITNIPEDSRFMFSAVSGEFKPRAILTIPVLSDHSVSAVISLACVHAYDASTIRLVNDIWSLVSARVNGMLAFRRIEALADRLDHQNRELDAQKGVLLTQAAETTQQNIELEMQKEQLIEANRFKSVFLSNMSHELRTPLNSVIALSAVLHRRLAGRIPDAEHSYIEIIERNGKSLLALINDILDLSRLEAGKDEITIEEFPVRGLVGDIIAMLEVGAWEKGITLKSQVSEDLPPIRSDRTKIRHILQNLVGNAVKFTETGSVDIWAHQVDDQVHIVVRDTGIGIAADQLAKIFEEFHQADESASRKYGGTGLGLAIALKYATILHGSITVESTPGEGSTFTLTLPLKLSLPNAGTNGTPTRFDPRHGGAARQSEAMGGEGKRILLVEDSEPAVIQITDILSEHGYVVAVARSGKQALEHLEKTLPDAMILDLMMPEMDGFEVLRTVRGDQKTAHLPVLTLTAKHVTKEERSFLQENNVHELIQKGDVSKVELLAAIAAMFTPVKARPQAAPPSPPSKPRLGQIAILVVEDNPDNLQTMRALLQETYTVIEAEDGRLGVELARQHKPDLILMDIALPVMDGFEALAKIRADEELQHIPVVAVTASAMKGNREEILAYGFDGYISKPVDEDVLQKTIHEVLSDR